jgi:hypothetical protein
MKPDELNNRLQALQIQMQEMQVDGTRQMLAINLERAGFERDKARFEAEAAAIALRIQQLTEEEVRKAIDANDLPKIKSFSGRS